MKSARFAIASALIATFISTSACIASQLKNLDRDTWIGTYAGQTKLSVRHLSVRRAVLKGQGVYCLQETEISLVGNVSDNKSISTRYINERFTPVYEVFKQTWKEGSKDRHRNISISYNASNIKYVVDNNGRLSHKSLSIPKGTDFTASSKYDLGVRRYRIGEKIELSYFDTENLGIKHIVVNAIRREKITVNGKKYDTTAIGIDKTPVYWRTNNGMLVKMSIPELGLTASIESPQEVLSSIENIGNPSTLHNKSIVSAKTFKAGRTVAVLMAQSKSTLRMRFANYISNSDNSEYYQEDTQDPDLLRDEWAGIYSDNAKIGYAHTTIRRDKFLGNPAYRRDYAVTFGFPATDGNSYRSEHSIITYCDENYNPLYILFDESAGDSHKSVEARFLDRVIESKIETDGNVTRQTIEVPEGSDFRTQCMFKFGALPVSVGDCYKVDFFNPMNSTIGSYTINVTRREKITLNGKSYDAYLTVPTEEPDAPSWQTENGYFIKSSMCNGRVKWFKETKEQAMDSTVIVR